ncbi:MAG TPA: ectoine/hydroxyectoine ABC transporter permease subunit EhuD [Anaerolineae bacterium]|nr:ectoine/hydroxyectoine ABC transporter permease subunit EhuD [Anaerolineae bacterium]
MPKLLEGLVVTIEVTFVAFIIAAVVGLLMALGRLSANPWIAQTLGLFIEFIRSTPLLVQLFVFFYILPRYGLRMPAFIVGTIALGVHYGTYTSEIYRAGIDAIDRGQWEAAKALNFSPVRTWVGIVLPQAIPPMIPALGNYLVAMFKESAQLSAITVVELTLTARTIGTQSFRFLEPFTMAGVLYFLISYPSSLVVQRLEKRYAGK